MSTEHDLLYTLWAAGLRRWRWWMEKKERRKQKI